MSGDERFVSEALAEHHVTADFDSGRAPLDDWLRQSALHARAMGTARTFVWTEARTARVVAYYAVAPHEIARADVPPGVGRGSPRGIPAVLLARLALQHSLQGRGLGSQLLVDALELIVFHARGVGGRLVVVDALDDEAAAFYRHHGFEAAPGDSRRLVQKLSRVAATLGLPWP